MSEPPLMIVRDLIKEFPISRPGGHAKTVCAVNGVSFHIRRAEILALVGESGCGKTTLARAAAMLHPPTSGSVVFEGREITTLKRKFLKRARGRMQMIFQDPYASLNPRMPVSAIIAEPLVIHSVGSRLERRAEALRLAQSVGLKAQDMDRYPHQFSGGQRQRIAIARALALKPALIFADEPVSALDVSIQSQILSLLRDLREEYGPAFLFIGHDLAVVRQIADRVAVMYLGRIVEEAASETLFNNPRHPYARALIAAAPRIGQGKRAPGQWAKRGAAGDIPSPFDPPPGCPFHPRCPMAEEVCKTTLPALEPPSLEPSEPGHKAACHFA